MSDNQISRFRGLNNVSDRLRLDASWLSVADNVDITDTGALQGRAGYAKAVNASAISGAFTTFDYQRMYVADARVLYRSFADNAPKQLATLQSTAAMYWTEVNDQVYFNNGVDSGVIQPDDTVNQWSWPTPGVPTLTAVTGSMDPGTYQVVSTYLMPHGLRTGAAGQATITLAAGQAISLSNISQVPGWTTEIYMTSANGTAYMLVATPSGSSLVVNSSPDVFGIELQAPFVGPIPAGADVVQFWGGRMYVAQYFPAAGQSVVWRSLSLTFHQFSYERDFFVVPGRVLMLAPHADALIVGTDTRISAYDGVKNKDLADYGVVPGTHWSLDDADDNGVRRLLFWSKRGVCAAFPFSNLTQAQVSVAPGVQAGGTIVRSHGQKRYVVALKHGGSAFNAYS